MARNTPKYSLNSIQHASTHLLAHTHFSIANRNVYETECWCGGHGSSTSQNANHHQKTHLFFLFIIRQQILPPPGSSLAKGDCVATILSPSKAKVSARITHEAANGALRIEFIPTEVGTHIIEVSISGTKLVGGPLIAKVYDTGLIQVTEVNGGVVGQPCQFRGTLHIMNVI